MKRVILIFILIFSAGIMMGVDYTKIDKRAESVPGNLKTAKDITRYLTKGLNSPTEKVRVIYFWMAHAIRYDIAKMNSNETYTDPQQLVDEVLKTRKGVCANYAALFHACCQSAGIQSYIIEGYTRQNDKIVPIAHAWNAVYIDGRFYNIDVTWAAGYVRGKKYFQQFRDNYFMILPVDFIKTHMPFDPVWQFSNNPVTHNDFESNDFAALKKQSDFNFGDSINTMSRLSTAEKSKREIRRITKAGITNKMIRDKVVQNRQSIATEVYNSSANNFNKGVVKYNEYIQYKNTQFNKLAIKDDKILELLSSARRLFESAEESLSNLNADDSDLKNPIHSMEISIKRMTKSLDEEDAFMSKYIKTSKPLRLILFYKRNG
jgi:hypothetical protein